MSTSAMAWSHVTSSASAECVDLRDFLWKNQSDVTLMPVTNVVFGLLYSLVVSLGVIGNVFVILAIICDENLRTVRNFFIASLSVSDIVVSIVSGTVTPITAFAKIWLFGPQLCKIVPILQGTSLCFSTWTLASISLDRAFLILSPHKKLIQKHHALLMIFSNVSLAFAISLPMFFRYELQSFSHYCGQICQEFWDEGEEDESLINRVNYGLVVLVLQFVLPLIVIAACYSLIYVKLSHRAFVKKRQREQLGGKLNEEKELRERNRGRRTTNMLLAMVVVFVCCWLPTVIFNFLRDINCLPMFILRQNYLWGIITHFISITSTVWNPVLYALMNENYRTAFINILVMIRRKRSFRIKKSGCASRAVSFPLVEPDKALLKNQEKNVTYL